MTTQERAKALVGDMPWVTDGMEQRQVDDLVKQVGASMEQVYRECNDAWEAWVKEHGFEVVADDAKSVARAAGEDAVMDTAVSLDRARGLVRVAVGGRAVEMQRGQAIMFANQIRARAGQL